MSFVMPFKDRARREVDGIYYITQDALHSRGLGELVGKRITSGSLPWMDSEKQIVPDDKPDGQYARLSLLLWDVNSASVNLDLSLSWSEGREPRELQRPGNDSPLMKQVDPWTEYEADPEVQWQGSWFITPEGRAADIISALSQLLYVLQIPRNEETRRALWNGISEDNPFISETKGLFDLLERLEVWIKQNRIYVLGDIRWLDKYLAAAEPPTDEEKRKLLEKSGVPMAASTLTLDALARRWRPDPDYLIRELKKWRLLVGSHLKQKLHTTEFLERPENKGRRIVAHLGCGDLSLNRAHAAFLPRSDGTGNHVIRVCADCNRNEFWGIVKWLPRKNPDESAGGGDRFSFETVRFQQDPAAVFRVGDARGGSADHEISSQVEYVVAGKPIVWGIDATWRDKDPEEIRDRLVIPHLQKRIDCFSDLRHLFELPNLNPKADMTPPGFRGNLLDRPRVIFDREQWDDVWLGEHVLLSNVPQNLARNLFSQSQSFDQRALGASTEHVEAALKGWGFGQQSYRDVKQATPQTAGQYSLTRNPDVFDIFFRPNAYPVSVIGITGKEEKDLGSKRLVTCVWQGLYSDLEKGFSIVDIAVILVKLGVTHALLFEEGSDPYIEFPVIGSSPKSNESQGKPPRNSPDLPQKRRKRPAVFLFHSDASAPPADSTPGSKSRKASRPARQ